MGRHSRLSAESKMAIVLEGLKGERSVAEICKEHGISQALYYRWRDGFLEGGRERLNGKKAEGELGALRHEVERLQKLIGKQAIQIEILKKTEELFGTR